jgi:hypothetical protein
MIVRMIIGVPDDSPSVRTYAPGPINTSGTDHSISWHIADKRRGNEGAGS